MSDVSLCHPERSERAARTESKDLYHRRMMRVVCCESVASIGVPRLLAALVARNDTRGRIVGDNRHENLISKRGSYRLLVPLAAKILPRRIHLRDERNFLFAPPALQLFLAANCGRYFAIGLVVQQSRDLIFGRKAAKRVFLMLSDAEGQVACNADVQRTAQTPEYVNRVAMFASGSHDSCAYRGPSTPRWSATADDLVAQDDRRKGVCAVTGEHNAGDEKFSLCHPERSERVARTQSKDLYKRRMMQLRRDGSRQLAGVGVPRLLATLVARDDTLQ